MNDESKNALFYPCFRQTLSLIAYKNKDNKHLEIENIIYSPFWKGDLNIIQKKSGATLFNDLSDDHFFLNKNYITIDPIKAEFESYGFLYSQKKQTKILLMYLYQQHQIQPVDFY